MSGGTGQGLPNHVLPHCQRCSPGVSVAPGTPSPSPEPAWGDVKAASAADGGVPRRAKPIKFRRAPLAQGRRLSTHPTARARWPAKRPPAAPPQPFLHLMAKTTMTTSGTCGGVQTLTRTTRHVAWRPNDGSEDADTHPRQHHHHTKSTINHSQSKQINTNRTGTTEQTQQKTKHEQDTSNAPPVGVNNPTGQVR